MKIILASTSRIRRQMLSNSGLTFETARPEVNEEQIKTELSGERPEYIAMALAKAKSLALSHSNNTELVIGADQVLSFEGETLSKPANAEVVREQLKKLRAKVHFLETAVACSRGGTILWNHHECCELTMRNFSDEFLEDYIRSEGDDICTSVGGYKLEGRGIQLFEKVRGDYFSILGLPLLPLLTFLRNIGAITS